MTNEQFFKLPRYAQNEINRLRNNVDYFEEKLNQLKGKEKTNVFFSEGGAGERPLPRRSRVTFKLGEHWNEKVDVYMNEEKKYLRISLDDMIVSPVASNVIRVSKKKRG